MATVLAIGGFRLLVRQPAISGLRRLETAHADPRRLRSDVTFLAATVAPRDVQHGENLARAGACIRSSFSAAGARVALQPLTIRGFAYLDVVARLGPHPLILGAHDDAFVSLARILERTTAPVVPPACWSWRACSAAADVPPSLQLSTGTVRGQHGRAEPSALSIASSLRSTPMPQIVGLLG